MESADEKLAELEFALRQCLLFNELPYKDQRPNTTISLVADLIKGHTDAAFFACIGHSAGSKHVKQWSRSTHRITADFL